MLPSNPAKLEARSGRRLENNAVLRRRDYPPLSNEERRTGKVDPSPDGRHAVKLLGRPSEKRRLIAPSVADEPLEAVLSLGPALRRAVVGRRGVIAALAASRPARTRRKSGLAAARMATTSGGGAASASKMMPLPSALRRISTPWERAKSSTVMSRNSTQADSPKLSAFPASPSLKNRLQMAPFHSGTQVQ
jgi:hypothetical protein